MMKRGFLVVLFYLAAIYDGILGLLFLLAGPWLFATTGITPPNHFGYLHFPAALLLTFGLLFLAVARKPERNRNLIPFGILLKLSYCGVAFYHWLTAGIPWIWKPFAIIDLVFLVLFVMAFRSLPRS